MTVSRWYVRSVDGQVDGPFHERQIANDLLSGQIPPDHQVRQGDGAWCDVRRAQLIFSQLRDQGWYVQSSEGEHHGPFTDGKMLDLFTTGELSAGDYVRRGVDGSWRTAQTVVAPWIQQNLDADEDRKWSTEPLRHQRVPLLPLRSETAMDQANGDEYELLRLEPPGTDDQILITRCNGEAIGRLSAEVSTSIFGTARRGVRHLTFLAPSASAQQTRQVIIVFCPPGTSAEACQSYVDAQFSSSRATNA